MLKTRSQCLRLAARQVQATCEKRPQYSRNFGQRTLSTSAPRSSRSSFTAPFYLVIAAGIGAGTVHLLSAQLSIQSAHAEAAEKEEASVLDYEKPKRKGREVISSQHEQLKKSWESPGVYIWGANSGHVAAPDSNEKYIKSPRRFSFFDGKVLRDLKLDRDFGAAIDENGDLLQWGNGFSDDHEPIKTLRGKNLKSLAISRDQVIALGANGSVYSVPASKKHQSRASSSRWWFPFSFGTPSVAYRPLTPQALRWTEKVTALASGLDHLLLLTSSGRVFSAPTSPTLFPTRGQLGIAGPLGLNSVPNAVDRPHQIIALRDVPITQIAAGDYHSLARDRDGRVFAFGDNSLGQLGLDYSAKTAHVDEPALIPIPRLYPGVAPSSVKVTGIAAGGTNSYFTVDATPSAAHSAAAPEPVGENAAAGKPQPATVARKLGSGTRVSADTWACGSGIWGTLGNGRWTHMQATPTKIPSLSGLYEWSEVAEKLVPIRVAALSVGGTHVAAVMNNLTRVGRSGGWGGETGTEFGRDVVFFGNNEFYQLGTGRRNNVSTPVHIEGLDREEEGEGEQRLQVTPRKSVKVGGRWMEVEQRVECGRGVTAVYSGV